MIPPGAPYDALRFLPTIRRPLRALAARLVREPFLLADICWQRLMGRKVRARNMLLALTGAGPVLEILPDWQLSERFAPSGGAGTGSSPAGMPARSPSTMVVDSAEVVGSGAGLPPHAEIVILVPTGCTIAADAVHTFERAFAQRPGAQLLYADEVLVDAGGRPVMPLLKPRFDPDLLMAVDYVGPVGAIRASALSAIGGFDPERPGCALLDLALRLAARFGESAVEHVPVILSMRQADRSTEEAEDVRLRGARLAATRASLVASVPSAEASPGPDGVVRVRRLLPEPAPLVSIVIPTRDRVDLLRPCVAPLLAGTRYPRFEIVVVDNGSSRPETARFFAEIAQDARVTILPSPGPFNYAALNNRAVRDAATGSVVVFLNNDVEILDGDWLSRLVAECLRPEIGAVGARLLYPGGLVQHGGVVLGAGGPANHAHRFFPADHPGYFHRLRATHRVAAVTGACLAVERTKFLAVDGFDAETFAVDFNDVDLCLRLAAAGFASLLVPEVTLLHKESASRGIRARGAARQRQQAELARFRARWSEAIALDPWYHPDFDDDSRTYRVTAAGRRRPRIAVPAGQPAASIAPPR